MLLDQTVGVSRHQPSGGLIKSYLRAVSLLHVRAQGEVRNQLMWNTESAGLVKKNVMCQLMELRWEVLIITSSHWD